MRTGQRGGEFGGNVLRGSYAFREPEIHQLRTRLRQHDVPGLQIAMDAAAAVRRLQSRRDLRSVPQCLAQWQRAPPETLRQRLALEQLHHEIADAVLRAYIMKLANVGMI